MTESAFSPASSDAARPPASSPDAAALEATFSGTTEVSGRNRFDEAALQAFFQREICVGPGDLRVSQFKGGQSNPTFLVDAGAQRYVVRRKPAGTLLPSAHAVEREFRVMKALRDTEVPVPRMFALCEDASVIGSAFYVMEYVDGRVLWDPTLPSMTAADRAATFDDINRVIAALHAVDIDKVGLQDHGRPGNYVERQLARWTKQYRASETEPIEAMDRLIEWLPAHAPASAGSAVVHGDYRLDNLVLHPTEPRVVAVLDWELSTLGDPLADFAYYCMVWQLPSQFRGLGAMGDDALAALGLPTEAEALARYSGRRGIAPVDAATWNFYKAFNLFRACAISQGIMGRALAGNASSAHALEAGAHAKALAAMGWAQVARG